MGLGPWFPGAHQRWLPLPDLLPDHSHLSLDNPPCRPSSLGLCTLCFLLSLFWANLSDNFMDLSLSHP